MENRYRRGMQGIQKDSPQKTTLSPWARYLAKHHRVPQDSHLVSFGDRVTYTFVVGTDVASIHYDKARGEIFYKGHKIIRSEMEPWMANLLNHFKNVLAKSEYADHFLDSFNELLDKILTH